MNIADELSLGTDKTLKYWEPGIVMDELSSITIYCEKQSSGYDPTLKLGRQGG